MWVLAGNIKGSPGNDGEDGSNGESPSLRTDSGYIQWKLPSDVAWTNLVELATISGEDGVDGDDGREVELQVGATHIQWRYVGDASWTDLVALTSLKGDPGDDGDNGVGVPTGGTTGQVLAKTSNTDYDTEWVDAASAGGGMDAEGVRDTMAAALVAGSSVTITPDDGADTITIAASFTDLAVAAGSAMNPHTAQGAARNSDLPKNFWQYAGTVGVDDPTNAVDGDEWISA